MTHASQRRPTIVMAAYGDITFDSRVRREASTLAVAGYDVRLHCLANRGVDDLADRVEVVAHAPSATDVLPRTANPYRGSAGRLKAMADRASWLTGYVRNLRAWGQRVLADASRADAWHAHDLTGLIAIAPVVGGPAPVVYDSHEIYLEAGTARLLPRPARALLEAYERRLVARTTAMVTVNRALEAIFAQRYRPRRIVVVHNCPDRWQRPAELPDRIRASTAIPRESPVILHHGSLGPHRGVEQLMEAILQPGVDQAHLVLLGFGESVERFRSMAQDGVRRGRVHILEAVPPSELLTWVTTADIGAVPIQPSTLNHRLSTPNKLFECLAAGVPVVVSDFPTTREIVLEDPLAPLGAVCDPTSPASIAFGIRSILELDVTARADLRARCAQAAEDRWNWQTESAQLVGLYDELLRT